MSGGLLALLDDVVALTKIAAVTLDDAAGQAAQASAKAAGVVIDDAAVTPRYVVGLAAERELPIVGRIAWGSLKNKLVFLLPAGLLITAFAPWLLTPILMIGGLYLCFEGYEKVHSMFSDHADGSQSDADGGSQQSAQELEDAKVAGAIRTDMVLSAEIMAISLASIVEPNLAVKALVLATVAFMVTAGVYGAVALIVKADDVGLYLAQKGGPISRPLGRALVYGMPPFLKALALVGTVAMLWVGGGILVHGLNEFGIHGPEHVQHAIAEFVRSAVPGLGGFLAWLATALSSAVVGLLAGAVTALVWGVVSAPIGRLFGRAT
jgi:uncharacterized protein